METIFKIHSKLFSTALAELKPVIGKRSVVPVCECVKLDSRGLTGTDLERFIFVPLPLGLDSPILVNYLELLNIVKGMTGILTVTVTPDGGMQIQSGNGSVKLSLYGEPDEFPRKPELGKCEAKFICPELSGMIGYVSTDELKPAMNGVYLSQGAIVATDAHILKVVKSKDLLIPGLSAIIPANVAKLVKERVSAEWYPNGEISYMKFTFSNRTELTFRLINERFPDYNQVIPAKTDKTPILRVNRAEMIKALNQVYPALNKTTFHVRLTVRENEMEVHGEDIDNTTEATANISCEWNGESGFEIGFNHKYLVPLLQDCPGEFVELELSTPNRASVIRDKNEVRLIMPCLIKTREE